MRERSKRKLYVSVACRDNFLELDVENNAQAHDEDCNYGEWQGWRQGRTPRTPRAPRTVTYVLSCPCVTGRQILRWHFKDITRAVLLIDGDIVIEVAQKPEALTWHYKQLPQRKTGSALPAQEGVDVFWRRAFADPLVGEGLRPVVQLPDELQFVGGRMALAVQHRGFELEVELAEELHGGAAGRTINLNLSSGVGLPCTQIKISGGSAAGCNRLKARLWDVLLENRNGCNLSDIMTTGSDIAVRKWDCAELIAARRTAAAEVNKFNTSSSQFFEAYSSARDDGGPSLRDILQGQEERCDGFIHAVDAHEKHLSSPAESGGPDLGTYWTAPQACACGVMVVTDARSGMVYKQPIANGM